MRSLTKQEKKALYLDRLTNLVRSYPRILVVSVDHVGSRQMAAVRRSLRGKAEILMGKNTMIRMVLNTKFPGSPEIESLIQCVKLNVGFVFCMADPMEVRKIILENRVPAPARQGVVAPCDVFIQAGPTGLDPSQTSFFQALGISTKIVKGQIEIQNEVHLIKKDERVSASGATLLHKLNKRPFSYGLKIDKVYDNGSVCDASVLDVSDDDIFERIKMGISYSNAFSLELGYPTATSVDSSILAGFKNCAALVIDSDYTFPEIERIKDMLKNPQAFATLSPAEDAAPPAKSDAKLEEDVEEEEDDMGFSLFD